MIITNQSHSSSSFLPHLFSKILGPAASQTTPSTHLITASSAQITMTAPRHSRKEKLLFCGREDDFPTSFMEQLEASVYALGLSDCFLNRLKTTPQKDLETNDERVKREVEEAELDKLQYIVWSQLVQCLDKASINSSEGTSRMGLQPGQLWRSSTNQLNGLVFNH